MRRPPEDLAEKLRVASNEFTDIGLDISVDEVAKLAGVPRATLYYYFGGKDDLVAFFINDKLELVGDVVAKAAAGEGPVAERLTHALTAVLGTLADYPVLCTELPAAVKQAGDYSQVMASMDRIVMTPLRELLIEGRATGELNVPDPATTALAMMGAIHMVAMTHTVTQGSLDAAAVAPLVVPQLVNGVLA